MTSTIKVILSSGDNATHNVSHRMIPPSRNRCAPRAFSKRSVELGDCCFKSGGSDRFRCSRSSSIRNNKRRTSGRVVKCKASLALTDVLFTTGTVMVMPFYALMISKPNSRVTVVDFRGFIYRRGVFEFEQRRCRSSHSQRVYSTTRW